MYFVLVIAFLSTLVYLNLIVTETINARINPYEERAKETSMLLSKIKYALLIIMSFSWAAFIIF